MMTLMHIVLYDFRKVVTLGIWGNRETPKNLDELLFDYKKGFQRIIIKSHKGENIMYRV